MMNEQIFKQLSQLLSSIDDEVYSYYKNSLPIFINYVNSAIQAREDVSILVGLNSFELVKQNHENHANFMYTIFLTRDVKSMHDTYIWAYKTYHAKGFDFRYFYLELIAWKESFELNNKKLLMPIIELYNYLISLHDYFVQHAMSTALEIPKNINENIYSNFLDAILKPDLTEAISISKTFIKTDEDIKKFWQYIILPALYSIGNKWANAEISVGEEHMATSICQRVMAEHYPKIISYIDDKKNILITTSPNELHEVGARILADILELNGYNVTFMSANSTPQEKFDIIELEEIEFVLISTTIVSNIVKTKELVTQIRDKFKHNTPIIIIGGQAFNENSDANTFVKADYLIRNINELLNLLKKTL